MTTQLIRTLRFSAAHKVPDWPEERGQRVHGHTYTIDLVVEGEPDEDTGWLVDFGEIRRAFDSVAGELDHQLVNDVPGLESGKRGAIADYIYKHLQPRLPLLKKVVVRVDSEQEYIPRPVAPNDYLDLPARVAFAVQAAHHLPNCGHEHPCRRPHGHSYRIEVGADSLAGLDAKLEPIYEALDHKYLNDIEGLANPTAENMAAWIWKRLEPTVADLSVVVVRESPDCACIYRGDGRG
jgi:6-pyruvoyltetrahydropterin/6-carboxytetrahydropterin synthase